jgi:lycopene beta-cyclase
LVTGAKQQKLVIAGGGLAGSLAALAMAERRPEVPILLLEQGDRFGGNHIWCFFDPDVAPADRWLVEPLIVAGWEGYDVAFPHRRRRLPTGYRSVRSERLDRVVRERLRGDQYRLHADIAEIDATGVTLRDGERIIATAVLDARGAANLDALDLGWQKFVGRDYQLAGPHGLERPIVMDATVDQADGYRFVYCLPFTDTRLLVEDTYYSTDPRLDADLIGDRIEAYLQSRGWRPAAVINQESGVLPVAMGGDFERLWPRDAAVGRLGMRGGFFHPTTGYSLPDAVRTATLLAAQPDLGSMTLARLLRGSSARLWRERGFYRLLNRMLFGAADPPDRYRVLEHFYRLDPELIGRFYAGGSTMSDKLRIMSGKPPVPIGKAITAMWRAKA